MFSDNAGKTTILKKFNGEDITEIAPTLGFNIKTLEHRNSSLSCLFFKGATSRTFPLFKGLKQRKLLLRLIYSKKYPKF